jgi:general secretion pathway protein J
MKRLARGFTLLELVVAISIFAIVGTMAYRGYAESASNAERARDQARRLQAVQLAVRTMVMDFRLLAPRPVREPVGDGFRPALTRDESGASLVELTRAGWSNTAGTPRGTLQRVAYALDNGKLVRLYWPVLDRTLATEPVRRELVGDVERVALRYMNASRVWVDSWPPLGAPGEVGFRQRPLAVEIVIEFKDFGRIRRVAEVAG